MPNKSYVTMEQKICPVCGKQFDTGAILLDQRLRDRFDHDTVTGLYICPEDQSKIDKGYIPLVVVDEQKSGGPKHLLKPSDAYRTGEILYMKKEAAAEVFNIQISKFAYIDEETARKIKDMMPKEKD